MTKLTARPVAASRVAGHVYKVFPNDLNAHGTIFGGLVMALCDRIALVVAERHSGHECVTASVDSVHFLSPAREGETLLVHAACNRAWRSSMEIGVRVEAEDTFTREERHVVSAYLTFVALDAAGRPIAVPPLLPETPEEAQRFLEAELRRNARLEHAAQLKALREPA
jgi:acyl-CoA hydrolase